MALVQSTESSGFAPALSNLTYLAIYRLIYLSIYTSIYPT